MKKKKRMFWIFVIIIMFVLILPYAVVEVNTIIWGDEFKEEYKQTGMISDINYYKVFYVIDDKAKIYYVDRDTGTFVYFVRDGDMWKLDEYQTVWSQNGSASGVTFPFYPHFEEDTAFM